MCIGGPPCDDSQPMGVRSSSSKSTKATETTTVAELSRVVVSTDSVRMSVFFGKTLLMTYQQGILSGNIPALFTYELAEEDVEKLQDCVTKEIRIATQKMEEGSLITTSKNYLLVG